MVIDYEGETTGFSLFFYYLMLEYKVDIICVP